MKRELAERLARIEADLRDLLREIGHLFPDERVAMIADYLDHGEQGIALHEICVAYEDFDLRPEPAQYERIVKAGSEMQLPPSTWESLR